jgi:hypothetical protein
MVVRGKCFIPRDYDSNPSERAPFLCFTERGVGTRHNKTSTLGLVRFGVD